MRSGAPLVVGGAVLLVGAALAGVVWLAAQERTQPARCPPGSVALGARCCGEGQLLDKERCVGIPTRCPIGTEPVAGERPGCVPPSERITIGGGELQLAPNDWQAEGVIEAQVIRQSGFQIDSAEVTHEQWQRCAGAGACPKREWEEPGRPVTNVSPEDAAVYCKFVGGRLPTGSEWLFAAAGVDARRFPWGQTGLVCRRAAFGLVDGPCGYGAVGPEVAGMRPDGASPEGVLDLAGNVAEWTVEPGGSYAVRGGSFRSRVVAELKTWATEAPTGPAPHVGFRCVYDRGKG